MNPDDRRRVGVLRRSMWQSHTFGPVSLTGLIPEFAGSHAAAQSTI
jgi:hypothetical protein